MSGDWFRVHVNFSEKYKWKVMVAAVHDGDEGCDNNIDDWLTTSDGKTMARMKGDKITPYRAVWVADLIKPVIFTTPGKFVIEIL